MAAVSSAADWRYVSACVKDVEEMSRWRERREERLVLAAPGGSWV